jgi:hypothetical protein
MVLIDNGITHNFIHRRIAKEIHFFVRPVSNFKIPIANGGMMKCGGHYENVKLQMGDYHMKNMLDHVVIDANGLITWEIVGSYVI